MQVPYTEFVPPYGLFLRLFDTYLSDFMYVFRLQLELLW